MREFLDIVSHLSEAPRNGSLSQRHAKLLLSHLEAARGQLGDVLRMNPWLVGVCQQAAHEKLGDAFPVYRAITVTGELRADTVASTSLDWRVAYSILRDAPGMIWHDGATITPKKMLLRYRLDPSKVVLWMPVALEFARTAVSGKEHQGVENRYGGRTQIAKILAAIDARNEQEVVADLTSLTPSLLEFDGSVKGQEMSAVFEGVMDDTLSNDLADWRTANHIQFMNVEDIRDYANVVRKWMGD